MGWVGILKLCVALIYRYILTWPLSAPCSRLLLLWDLAGSAQLIWQYALQKCSFMEKAKLPPVHLLSNQEESEDCSVIGNPPSLEERLHRIFLNDFMYFLFCGVIRLFSWFIYSFIILLRYIMFCDRVCFICLWHIQSSSTDYREHPWK